MAHAHRITAGELVVVCSHYDLGEIAEVRRFRGGSRVAPKVYIKTPTGEFLLKRRAPGPSSDPAKVAFTHEVMLHLASRGFPVPALMATRRDRATMLQLGPSSPGGGGVYEVFRFVRGVRYDRSRHSAFAAGWWLARCHGALREFRPLFPAPRRTFHAHPKVPERLASISGALSDPALRPVTRSLGDAYIAAAREADRAAPPTSPDGDQIVHGDWHPGNMLFSEGPHAPTANLEMLAPRVAAVIDFDSARLGQPLHDLANGAMQFAVQRFMGQAEAADPADEEDAHHDVGLPVPPPKAIPPSAWRIALDPELLAGFYQGYRAAGGAISAEALRAVPWLMVEALIVEVCVPIAATGKFGKLSPAPVLGVVHRAVDALRDGADRIVELARGA